MQLMHKPEQVGTAKTELFKVVKQLLPDGEPTTAVLGRYPTIKKLIALNNGDDQPIEIAIQGLILDFCSGFNVIRPMDVWQIKECSMMLVSDLGTWQDYRLEDYVLMFTMAKRKKLDIKILDRIDIDVISTIRSEYDKWRKNDVRMKKEALKQEEKRKERYRERTECTPEQVAALVAEAHATIKEGAAIRNAQATTINKRLAEEQGYKESAYLEQREQFLNDQNNNYSQNHEQTK